MIVHNLTKSIIFFLFTEIVKLNFNSKDDNTCVTSLIGETDRLPRYKSWRIHVLRSISNFSVSIGPAGGDRGYYSITGQLLFIYLFICLFK